MLRKLAQCRPKAGWRLLVGLLPNQQPISMPIYRPSWRDWALGWSPLSRAAYSHQVGACGHLLVEQLGDDIERWKALIEQFENLPGPVQKEFLERLNGFAGAPSTRKRGEWSRKPSGRRCPCTGSSPTRTGRFPRDPRGTGEGSESLRAGRPGTKERLAVRAALASLETLEGQEERLERASALGPSGSNNDGGWKKFVRLVEAVEAPEEVGVVFADRL